MRIGQRIVGGWLTLALLGGLTARACIWDSDTLFQEKLKSPKLAEVILGKPAPPPDPKPLLKRIAELHANPRKDDPEWWNELAGAYLRLGRAQEAADMLEPVVQRFPDNYGIHANLGTAYHLLGRYAEAEKHIARDLEINPDAHFGLEKYHLALLQYLIRDEAYRKEHLYVDEFSLSLTDPRGNFIRRTPKGILKVGEKAIPDYERMEWLDQMVRTGNKEARWEIEAIMEELEKTGYEPPPYRYRWNLAEDPKLIEGVIYMATLNPNEPACFAMLGIVCLKQGDLNLAAAAFDRAVAFGSPYSEALKDRSTYIRNHISEARWHNLPGTMVLVSVPLLIVLWAISLIMRRRNAKPDRQLHAT